MPDNRSGPLINSKNDSIAYLVLYDTAVVVCEFIMVALLRYETCYFEQTLMSISGLHARNRLWSLKSGARYISLPKKVRFRNYCTLSPLNENGLSGFLN